MDELAGGRRSADSPPHLPDELLLRLPPEPIYLFRASLVFKRWRGLVHDARFRRRFREFHGDTSRSRLLQQPIRSSLLRPHLRRLRCPYRCHDARGRLVRPGLPPRSRPPGKPPLAKLLVWDLVTGDKSYLPRPAAYEEDVVLEYNGAVLCAAGHTDHGGCHSCPSIVAFVFSRQFFTFACVYSSETGVWGEITSIHFPDSSVARKPAALVRNSLYWLLNGYEHHGIRFG